jgi:serine/threonine protein kinase
MLLSQNIWRQPQLLVMPSKVSKDPVIHDLCDRMLEHNPAQRIRPKEARARGWFVKASRSR